MNEFDVDDKLVLFGSILKVHFQKCFKKINLYSRIKQSRWIVINIKFIQNSCNSCHSCSR